MPGYEHIQAYYIHCYFKLEGAAMCCQPVVRLAMRQGKKVTVNGLLVVNSVMFMGDVTITFIVLIL